MRANEFVLLEKDPATIARTPAKGGITLGQAVQAKMKEKDGKDLDGVAAVEQISQGDPTKANKYTPWLVKIYLTDPNYRVPEDNAQIKADLTKYMKLANAKKLKPEERDLNRLKTLNQLYDIIEQYGEEDVKSGKEKKREIKHKGAEVIIDEPNLTIIKTTTHEANCYYGAGTKWCTASKDDDRAFNHYNEEGPIYVIMSNNSGKPRKYQLHVESDQFLNERDQPVTDQDIQALSKNPGWAKFLNMLIKEYYGKYLNAA